MSTAWLEVGCSGLRRQLWALRRWLSARGPLWCKGGHRKEAKNGGSFQESYRVPVKGSVVDIRLVRVDMIVLERELELSGSFKGVCG